MTRYINPYKLFHGSFIPSWLLERTEVSSNAKLVYARLGKFAGKDGYAYPGINTIGEEVGLSRSTVIRALGELKSFGLIESHQRGLTKTNSYHFPVHPWMEFKDDPSTVPSVNLEEVPNSDDTPKVSSATPIGVSPSILQPVSPLEHKSIQDKSIQKKSIQIESIQNTETESEEYRDSVPSFGDELDRLLKPVSVFTATDSSTEEIIEIESIPPTPPEEIQFPEDLLVNVPPNIVERAHHWWDDVALTGIQNHIWTQEKANSQLRTNINRWLSLSG